MLIGARYGFISLANDFKSKPSEYNIYSKLISDIFNANFPNFNLPTYTPTKINIDQTNVGELGTKLNLIIGNKVLLSKSDHGPDELNKVLINARSSSNNMNFKVDRANMRLSYDYNFLGNRHQKVYVSVGQPTKSGAKTLRVWSPCLNLNDPSSKLKYNFVLLDLIMKMHTRPDTKCRIGMHENQTMLIAMRDQMVESSDSIELEMLEHVASFADDFEMQYGKVDNY